MTNLDYIILSFLGYFVFRGIQKGFVRLVFDLLGLFGGTVIGFKHYHHFVHYFQNVFDISQYVATIISFIFILMVLFSISIVFARLLDKVLQVAGLGLINRLAGAGLGLVKGSILLVPILIGISIFRFDTLAHSKLASQSIPYLQLFIQRAEITELNHYLKNRLHDNRITVSSE
jgi:membrane protein required for colicin V production